MVLAPGMLCDRAVWTEQIRAFSAEVDLLVPGYGAARSMTAMAAAVLAQAAPRFSIAGHSMGGRVALEVLRLAPQRVERLCLLSTEHRPAPPGEPGRREREGRRALLALAHEKGMGAVAQAWLPHLIAPARQEDETLVREIVAMIGRRTPEELDAQIAAGETRRDSGAVLRAAACPLLIMGGAEDAIRPPASQRAMAALAPHARLHILEGCGHMITLERPEAVTLAMTQWLAQPA
jgi:pimeloyl-ACP methyl ester carboxylesterase